MTNQELIREVRKPGDIEMPVLTAHGCIHLLVKKADLLLVLADQDPQAEANWTFYGEHDGARRLDVNS